jgi:hypothetical protein
MTRKSEIEIATLRAAKRGIRKMISWLMERVKVNVEVRQRMIDLFDEIDRTAEADFAKGGPIKGAHHRAIELVRKTLLPKQRHES